MNGPRSEIEARVLEGLEVPRAVGDLLFLFPALKESGRAAVEAAIESLGEVGLVRRSGSRLWEVTEAGSAWLVEQAEWQIRVGEVFKLESRGPALIGTLDRGVVKVGDWFHDGVGGTGRVVAVDSFDPVSGSIALVFESAARVSADSVLRRWTPLASDAAEALLSPSEWDADRFEDDLASDGSLPDITARFAPGRSWDDVHTAITTSALRWEYWKGDAKLVELPPAAELFADDDGDRHLVKVWVGPVQFNAHYWVPEEVDFDVEIGVLAEQRRFECLVAFMDWIASIARAEVRLAHEGAPGALILLFPRVDASQDPKVRDRLRLAELRNPVFGTYRGVVAPAWRLDEANVDAWLEQHGDPDLVTGVLCHVHLWDEIESMSDEVVLGEVAGSIAERWRSALEAQFPDRPFDVGVAGEPDEYGPTVWARPAASDRNGVLDQLDADLLDRLAGVAAARWVGGFRPVDAVAVAADLVATGIEEPAVVKLAIQSTDPNALRDDDIRALFDDCCAALGLDVPSISEAGWQRARDIATTIIAGIVPPGEGAARLWPLWEECGGVPGSDPLDMLQLFEEWEGSVGDARRRAEERIVASARSVIADADRALAAMALPAGCTEGVVRAQDVMPLLLAAVPSFLDTWFEIEADHLDRDTPAGRLHYLDTGVFARHIIEVHRWNNKRWQQNAFDLIERMHTEGDAYVRELATIGYLEGIQNAAGHAGFDPEVFAPYLGAESARWWRGLDKFWTGEHPVVEPDAD